MSPLASTLVALLALAAVPASVGASPAASPATPGSIKLIGRSIDQKNVYGKRKPLPYNAGELKLGEDGGRGEDC